MKEQERKEHWEKVYRDKTLEEVSWYQAIPQVSLDYLENAMLPLDARIIDVGGGDGFLVDFLIDMGFEDITVLDVSSEAIARAKTRLGEKAKQVTWIESDVLDFNPEQTFDFWHDRAVFHFLNNPTDQFRYVQLASRAVEPGGRMLVGTFSDQGPRSCSGIMVQQYTEESLSQMFEEAFEPISCQRILHQTPSNSQQEFVFCYFERH